MDFRAEVQKLERRVRRKTYHHKPKKARAEDLARIYTLYEKVFDKLLKAVKAGHKKKHTHYLNLENRLDWLDRTVAGSTTKLRELMHNTGGENYIVRERESERESEQSEAEGSG